MSECTAIVPADSIRPGLNDSGSTIAEALFVAVSAVAAEQVALPALGGAVLGVTMGAIADNEYGDIQTAGKAIVTAGGTVARGDQVSTLTTGRAIVATGSVNVLGTCVKGGASGELIEVELAGIQGSGPGTLVTITRTMTDVSAAETVYFPIPVAGTIERIDTVLGGAITAANAVLTTNILAAGVGAPAAVTGGGITVAFTGSGAGVTDSATPSAANTVAAGDSVSVVSDGGSSTTATLGITLTIRVS